MKTQVKQTLENLFMAFAMVIMLVGGMYAVAGIIAINQMDMETPTWKLINIALPSHTGE